MAILALLSATMLAPTPPRDDDEEPPPPVKEIMGALNKGPEALTSKIGRALDKAEPNWASLADRTETYVGHVKDLGRNSPPRGGVASWKTQTKEYLENAEALDDAVAAHDRKAALAAHEKIEQACAGCHVKHKP